MKVLIICIIAFACAVGAMDVCTGLKKLHSDNGCCGNTGSTMCVANPAQHYLGTRSQKITLHPLAHHHLNASNVMPTHIHYKCPHNDTVTYNEKVATWTHSETFHRTVGTSGSWVEVNSTNITTVYNKNTEFFCHYGVRTDSGRRFLRTLEQMVPIWPGMTKVQYERQYLTDDDSIHDGESSRIRWMSALEDADLDWNIYECDQKHGQYSEEYGCLRPPGPGAH